MSRLTAEKRGRVLDLLIAGATPRQIADRLELTEAAVSKAIRAGIDKAAKERAGMAADAATVRAERADALFRAHYPQALRGDHKSAEICCRILAAHPAAAADESDAMSAIAIGLVDTELAALEALRDRLAREMDACTAPRVLAALTRQFVMVLRQVEERRPQTGGDSVDEISARRAARRAAAASAVCTERSG